MERIDLKAATKSTLLTLTLALALEFAQNTTKGEGAFLSKVWSLEGEGGQMTRCHHREGERRPKLGVD